MGFCFVCFQYTPNCMVCGNTVHVTLAVNCLSSVTAIFKPTSHFGRWSSTPEICSTKELQVPCAVKSQSSRNKKCFFFHEEPHWGDRDAVHWCCEIIRTVFVRYFIMLFVVVMDGVAKGLKDHQHSAER